MSFIDDVNAASRPPGPRCSFARLDLPDADAADLEQVLADAAIPASAIAKALQARGHAIKQQTVTRHRQRDCSCPPAQVAA